MRVRLVVDRGHRPNYVCDIDLADIPIAGDVIQLKNGARCLVQDVSGPPDEPSNRAHTVYASVIAY